MLETAIDHLGTPVILVLAGGLIGLMFGIMAERSSFCLRAACVEVAQGVFGPRLMIWFLAFGAAVGMVQALSVAGALDLSQSRVLSAPGSVSGAVLGGLMFGIGMILARGCASRLLVLSATGNLRALVTGLVLTLVAQASYSGALSPVRLWLASLWVIDGGPQRSFASSLNVPVALIVLAAIGLVCVAWMRGGALGLSQAQRAQALGVGITVAAGWLLTYTIQQNAFDIVPLTSITFAGPSTDTLMVFIGRDVVQPSFALGLVPGVATGAALSAVSARRWHIERFEPQMPMERYLLGATMMGFGAMLAGGCAVGAGLSGGSALSITALLAVACMWIGAMAAHGVLSAGSMQRVSS